MHSWNEWLERNWALLVAGHHIDATYEIPHPSHAGFESITLAEPHGQLRDWGLALRDGSRLHVHEHADGRLVVHRDKIDPSRGVIAALQHFFTETVPGPLIVGAAVIGIIGVGVTALVGASSGAKKSSRYR